MSDRLRIGMFSWESLYSVKVGGVSPHVSYLSESLARQGHEVHIITRTGNNSNYDFINGVHYQRCPTPENGNLLHQMDDMCGAMIDRFYAVEDLFGKFDVLHIHDWHPVMVMNSIKKNRDIPWIMSFHSTEYGRNGNNFTNSNLFRQISHQEWLGGYEASQIITVSDQMRNELNHVYQIPDDKINVVPNGVNAIKKKVDIEEVKNRYDVKLADPLILFLGRMAYQKGPDLLVNAIGNVLKKNGNSKFVFAGDGDMRSMCQNMALNYGIKDSCRFLGYVNDDERVDLMNACDIYCVPSRNEPFGITVLEAWTATKPVLATEAISMIDNFVDGIRVPTNSDAISYYMNVLLEDPRSWPRMGKAGENKAKTKYNWDKIGDQTIEIYNRILS